MTEPLIEDLQADLHGALIGEQLLCDYHGTPVSLATDDSVLVEAIRILYPRYKAHEEVRWQADAVRCADCTIEEITPATFGFEEAVLQVPVTRSTDVVSTALSNVDDIAVLACRWQSADGDRSAVSGGGG